MRECYNFCDCSILAVATKYKLYQKLRRGEDTRRNGPDTISDAFATTTPKKSTRRPLLSSPDGNHENMSPESSPVKAVRSFGIYGPTPQSGGRVLGLFDCMHDTAAHVQSPFFSYSN